jgi:predicted DNA-binding transcriptional regulator YafY
MAGWQDMVAVGERRAAAVLSHLVNARGPVEIDSLFAAVPDFSADAATAAIELDDDVDRLRSFGLHIDWEGPGSPFVGVAAESWQHRPVSLDDEDRALLARALEAASPLDAETVSAAQALDVDTLMPEADTTISLSPRGSAARGRPEAYSRLHRLAGLIDRRVVVGFGYPDASGAMRDRALEVAGLGESRGVWYAVGVEPGSGTMTAFAVSDMRGPVREVSPEGAYEPPAGFDLAEHLALAWRLGPDPVSARVRFDRELAGFMESVLAHVRLDACEDGSAEAVVAVGNIDDFVAWTLMYGTHALVLEPPAAVERAREILSGVVRQHA